MQQQFFSTDFLNFRKIRIRQRCFLVRFAIHLLCLSFRSSQPGFAGNDFLNRTIHNEIKVGCSRFSVFMARTITTVIMAVLLHLTYVFATVIGFAVKYRLDGSIFSISNFVWLLVVMLQICANICIVMFIVFCPQKSYIGNSGNGCFQYGVLQYS